MAAMLGFAGGPPICRDPLQGRLRLGTTNRVQLRRIEVRHPDFHRGLCALAHRYTQTVTIPDVGRRAAEGGAGRQVAM